jgi:DHA2 family multidrug resistance protein
MLILALAMWHATALVPDANFWFFARMRVFQTLALPFLFVPISTASYAGLPATSTNQASALINVARNLGGSIGVSLANSMLAERGQFHQSRLVEHIFPSSPIYQNMMPRLTEVFVAQGVPPLDAQRRAVVSLGLSVQSQSTLLAYIDVFWLYAVLALAMIPLALMLRRVDMRAAPAMH